MLFGVVHGLGWDDGVQVSVEAMLWAGVPGLVLVWLRERTGSLVLPVVAHDLANSVAVTM